MSDKIIRKIAVGSGIGAGTGMLFSSIIIILIAAVLAMANVPAMLIAPSTVLATAIGAFFGGFISAKICGEKGIICGAVSGVIFFMVLWIAGGIMGTGDFGTGMIIKALMIIGCGSFGGIIGVNYIGRK